MLGLPLRTEQFWTDAAMIERPATDWVHLECIEQDCLDELTYAYFVDVTTSTAVNNWTEIRVRSF